MNALKNKREQSRAYREAQGFIIELLELMSLAYAPELHFLWQNLQGARNNTYIVMTFGGLSPEI